MVHSTDADSANKSEPSSGRYEDLAWDLSSCTFLCSVLFGAASLALNGASSAEIFGFALLLFFAIRSACCLSDKVIKNTANTYSENAEVRNSAKCETHKNRARNNAITVFNASLSAGFLASSVFLCCAATGLTNGTEALLFCCASFTLPVCIATASLLVAGITHIVSLSNCKPACKIDNPSAEQLSSCGLGAA